MKVAEWIKKKCRERKLRLMDRQWERSGASSWGLFAPSVYYTHTEEEIRQMTEKQMAEVRELIEKL